MFRFQIRSKGFDGLLDPQQLIQFTLFSLYKPFPSFLLYLYA